MNEVEVRAASLNAAIQVIVHDSYEDKSSAGMLKRIELLQVYFQEFIETGLWPEEGDYEDSE